MVQGRDDVPSQGLPWEQIQRPFVHWQSVTPPVGIGLTFPPFKEFEFEFLISLSGSLSCIIHEVFLSEWT